MIYQSSISPCFIQNLFDNPQFQRLLNDKFLQYSSINSDQYLISKKNSNTISTEKIIQQTTQLLCQHLSQTINTQCHQIISSNLHMMEQLEQLRQQIQKLKISDQVSTAQKDKSMIGNCQILYDNLNFIRLHKDVQQIQEKINQMSFINSFTIEQQDCNQSIKQKINTTLENQITTIYSYVDQKINKFTNEIQRKIDQISKTTNNLINLVNELTINNSKPATKSNGLSTLFGFKK